MKSADKHPRIRKIQSEIMGTNVEYNIVNNVCSSCGELAIEFNSLIAEKEFAISGLCQACQDVVFGDLTEDEEEDFDEEKGRY